MRRVTPAAGPPGSDPLPRWLSTLLHITDSAYPIGGFAHSGGTEGMVGLDRIRGVDDLRNFLHQEVAETLACVDLPLLYHAWHSTTAQNRAQVMLLDQLSEATRFSAEQRQASRRLGRQRWGLFQSLLVCSLPGEERDRAEKLGASLPHRHLCIVAGIEASFLQVPVHAAMAALSHQTVMMVGQAALKILRIGQTSVQALVAEMTRKYPALIDHAQTLGADDIGACMPLFDIATAWHESAPARMFLS